MTYDSLRRVSSGLLAAVLVACSSDSSETEFTRRLQGSNGSYVVTRVVDGTGGLADIAPLTYRSLLESVNAIETAIDPQEPDVLHVAWTLNPCELAPTLRVEGDSQNLRLELDGGAMSLDDCPAVGILYGVSMTFAGPIANATIDCSAVHQGHVVREPDS